MKKKIALLLSLVLMLQFMPVQSIAVAETVQESTGAAIMQPVAAEAPAQSSQKTATADGVSVTASGVFTQLTVAPVTEEKAELLSMVSNGGATYALGDSANHRSYTMDISLAGLSGKASIALRIPGVDMSWVEEVKVLHLLDSAEAIEAASDAFTLDVEGCESAFASELAAAQAYLGGDTTEIYAEYLFAWVENGCVCFETASCSSFTVDFHYKDVEFSIPGQSSILLSELFAAIGYTMHSADEAVDVLFSDASLVAVEPLEGDWLLRSLAAFDTEEALTVVFSDGEVMVIGVTDDAISEMKQQNTNNSVKLDTGIGFYQFWGNEYNNDVHAFYQTSYLTGSAEGTLQFKDHADNTLRTISGTLKPLSGGWIITELDITSGTYWFYAASGNFDQDGINNSHALSLKRSDFTVYAYPRTLYSNSNYCTVYHSGAFSLDRIRRTVHIYENGVAIGQSATVYTPGRLGRSTDNISVPSYNTAKYWGYDIQLHSNGTDYIINLKTKYTVNFNGNGNTGGSTASQGFNYGTAQNLRANGFNREYTVSFDGNGGSANQTSAVAKYTFKNWNTAANGSGTSYSDKQSVNNLTASAGGTFNLYAQWTSGSVTLPNATRTGYTHTGWNTKADGTGTHFGKNASYTPTSNGTVLYAEWEPITYTVTYVEGAGSHVPDNTYTIEEGFTISPAPTYEGHTFLYWEITNGDGSFSSMIGKTYGTSSVFGQGLYGNVTFTARWGRTAYTVTYDLDGGTGDSSQQTYDVDNPPTLHGVPTKAGCIFGGWLLVAESGTHNWSTGATFFEAGSQVAHGSWGNVTLKALWVDAYGYALNFDANGGSGELFDMSWSLRTETSWKFDWTAVPTRTGYAFKGWALTPDGTVNVAGSSYNTYTVTGIPNQTVTVTLYAIWETNDYTITYDLGGGKDGPGSQTYTYEQNVVISATEPTRDGYVFAGWYLDRTIGGWEQGTYQPGQSVGSHKYENITLTAQWEEGIHRVTYNANGTGVTGLPEPQEKTAGVALTLSAVVLSRNGYRFTGWNTAADGTGTDYAPGASYTQEADLTLYAQWALVHYTITYESGHDDLEAPPPVIYTIEDTITIHAALEDLRYIFSGWLVTSADGRWTQGRLIQPNVVLTGGYGNVTLTAQWDYGKYTAIWKNYDGTVLKKETDLDGSRAPTPPKESEVFRQNEGGYRYIHDGWSREINDHEQIITFTAQYVREAISYTVTYDTAGGSAVASMPYTVEGVILAAAPTRPGYTFAGWMVAARGDDCTWPEVGDEHNIFASGASVQGKRGDVTLIARWTAIEYTVTYQVTPGLDPAASLPDGLKDPVVYTADAAVTLTSLIPTREHYEFTGWKLQTASGSWTNVNTVYASGAELGIENYGNVILVAQWKAKTYYVTYDPGFGGLESSAHAYTYEHVGLMAPHTQRENYNFLGWKPAEKVGSWQDDLYDETTTYGPHMYGNVTMVAQWARKTGNLTVSKTGSADPNQTFVFRIINQTLGIDIQVVVTGNGSVTVYDLPVGTYTVVESGNWSWRYNNGAQTSQNITVYADQTVSSGFANTLTNSKWFSAIHKIVNIFKRKEGQ